MFILIPKKFSSSNLLHYTFIDRTLLFALHVLYLFFIIIYLDELLFLYLDLTDYISSFK